MTMVRLDQICSGYRPVDVGPTLARGIEELRRIASYDAEIEARVCAGEGEGLKALLQRRGAALARLEKIAEELKRAFRAPEKCTGHEADLQGTLRTLAEGCLATTKDHINRLQDQIAVLQRELDSLQASRTALRRYLPAQEAQRTDFTG